MHMWYTTTVAPLYSACVTTAFHLCLMTEMMDLDLVLFLSFLFYCKSGAGDSHTSLCRDAFALQVTMMC